jgi:D-3-phosphoglycerate dehydrogenase
MVEIRGDQMKALVIDRIHSEGMKLLEKYCEVKVDLQMNTERLAAAIGEYDLLLGRATQQTGFIQAPLLEKSGKLKVIGIASVGLDQFDLEYIRSKGIHLIHLPGVNSISVAEHTFSLLLCGMRYLLLAYEQMKGGIWNKHGFTDALELNGKAMGIIGFGRIGQAVARIAKQGFGMHVTAYDPYLTAEEVRQHGAEQVSLEQLLSLSDIVTIHAPLTNETKYMIGDQEMSIMKPGSILLNAGRGGIIDEQALFTHLQCRHLRFAGIDVQEQEPCYDSPLFELDNFIATPHIAGLTDDALRRAGIRIVRECLQALGIKADSNS